MYMERKYGGMELIIALPESFVDYEPDKLLKLFTEHFRQNYGVECIAALHHNKRKTNYHIHLIFSERKLLDDPVEKITTRNMFYDENGRHVRTKKEILDEAGQLRSGCKIIPKGEVYERNIFTIKDSRFKSDSFLDEVKRSYTDLINIYVRDDKEKLKVFDKNSVYLPMQKVGKNNPKAEQIEADNRVRTMWNQTVDRALVSGVPEGQILEVKQSEIGQKAKASIQKSGRNPVLFKSLIMTAIGEEIYRQQEENGWGKSIVQVLSTELQKEFPGAKGYSAANLWRMRNFYLTYRDSEKLAPLVREISWSNNIIIMEKCKDDLQREFYIQMVKRYGWTKRILTNFIEAQTYEKYLLNQTNFDLTLPVEQSVKAKLAVKDEYTFDFAELSPEYSEHELEMQLVNNIRAFLIEMGGDYTFIGNQYHLMAGSRDLYIDLLLFHRRLRSLIAIELKIGEFEAEYAGKMQLYLTTLDEQVKLPDENPSIGIIICKSKDKTYVEYALKNINAPIGVATYQLRNTLPEEMKAMLPEPEEIVKRLRIFEEI